MWGRIGGLYPVPIVSRLSGTANWLSSFQVVSSQHQRGSGGAAALVQRPAWDLPGETQHELPRGLHIVCQVGGSEPVAPGGFKSECPQLGAQVGMKIPSPSEEW